MCSHIRNVTDKGTHLAMVAAPHQPDESPSASLSALPVSHTERRTRPGEHPPTPKMRNTPRWRNLEVPYSHSLHRNPIRQRRHTLRSSTHPTAHQGCAHSQRSPPTSAKCHQTATRAPRPTIPAPRTTPRTPPPHIPRDHGPRTTAGNPATRPAPDPRTCSSDASDHRPIRRRIRHRTTHRRPLLILGNITTRPTTHRRELPASIRPRHEREPRMLTLRPLLTPRREIEQGRIHRPREPVPTPHDTTPLIPYVPRTLRRCCFGASSS